MQKFRLQQHFGTHHLFIFIFIVILLLALSFFSLAAALIGFVVMIGLLYYFVREEKENHKLRKQHQEALAHRIKKTGDDVIGQFPIGIVLYNEQELVEWSNATVLKMSGLAEAIGLALDRLGLGLDHIDLDEGRKQQIAVEDKTYEIVSYREERLLYITDVTAYEQLLTKYHREQLVIGIIHMDNYDEVTQGMDDQQRSHLSSQVTKLITDWAAQHQIFIRRHTSDKFLVFLNQGILEELIDARFDILDIVRDYTGDHRIPITLSIGMATGGSSLIDTGRLTQTSLDIALSRGGDQAALREGAKLTFYGGKSNAVEKRTRVRARVISHVLRDLIRESDQVMIIGHKAPDMDAIGSALGILRTVTLNNQTGYIVVDKVNPSIGKLMKLVQTHETLGKYILSPDEAYTLSTQKTLLIVVDTHRPSLTLAPKLLEVAKRVVVIDHHRRSEEFIEDAVLYYIEPYASSTSELVTELLSYQAEHPQLDPLEATALLAGIVVDTRSFTYRTGARTFEAASLLRRWGADNLLVQALLKEDMTHVLRRTRLISELEIYFDNIAITVGEEDEFYDQVLVAQTADSLLDMDGIVASFVIAKRTPDQVIISARSSGEMNVQVIMEHMGGGGHLSNAATQMKGKSIAEAKNELLQQLTEIEGSVAP